MRFNDVIKSNVSPKGYEYRVSGIDKIENSKKWINGNYKHQWFVLLTFPELNKKAILKIDYNDKVIKNMDYWKYLEAHNITEEDCNKDEKITKILNYT